MTDLVFKRESFLGVMPELPELFLCEYEETVEDPAREKLAPAWKKYVQLEANQLLHLLTARADGRLVGYILNILYEHLKYEDLLCCAIDRVYLLPEFRQGYDGLKMLRQNEKLLQELQVKKFSLDLPSGSPLLPLTKRLKYLPSEGIFSKWL